MDARIYIKQIQGLLDTIPHDAIDRACDTLITLRKNGGMLYLFGNGGSASLASHLACDFNKGVTLPPLLRVNCLNDHMAEITALANDTEYDNIFTGQLRKLLQPHDMVFAISTSGNSANVVNALKYCRGNGTESIGLFGFDGGEAAKWTDIPIIVSDTSVQRLEDIHVIISHIVYLNMLEPVTSTENSEGGKE